MKIRQAYRVLLVLAIVMAMSAAVTVKAQDELLTNPGFEPPFDPVEGVVPGQIAQGWSPWFSADDGALQPEYYPASDTVSGMGSPRIHGGTDAQQYFTFFSGHVAGVYQQVSGVAAGDQLEFSIFAWVWSTSQENPDQSDPDADLTVEVGIDPTGGTDATSPSIIWSEPSTTFDEFTRLSVAATAQGDTATVFVRSNVNQVLMNNVVYIDDASLMVTGQVEVTAEATVEVTEATEVTEVATSEVTDEATDAVVEVTEIVPVMTDAVTEEPTIAVEPIETLEVTEVVTEEPTTTVEATLEVTDEPTEEPTVEVTTEVTEEPTAEVTHEATPEVTVEATTEEPTAEPPTATPSETPIPTLPVETPTLIPTEVPPTAVPPTATPLPTLNVTMFPFSVTYVVQNGDIVADIAQRYSTTVEAIMIANGLNPDAFIVVNQVLIIPVQTLPVATVPPTEAPTIEVQQVLPTPTQIQPTFPPTLVPTLVPPTLPPLPTVTSDVEVQSVSPTASTFYVVQYGDTLSSIAWRFRLTTRDLARANGIVNPNLVYVGQVLIIPTWNVTPTPVVPTLAPPTRIPPTLVPPTSIPPTQPPVTRMYRVMPGDTLFLISVRFNVRISDLMRINRIVDANRIYVGQVLYLP